MLNKARVRPSKISSIGAIIGAIFFLFFVGAIFLNPVGNQNSDPIFWVWGIGAVILVIFSIIISYGNIKSRKGIPYTEVDFEHTDNETSETLTFDQKLKKLNDLKKDGLITEEEFNKKRSEILSQKW